MIYKSILDTIGKTPLVEVYSNDDGTRILAKLEYFNPGGSVKDRPALNMIEEAEKQGFIDENTTIIEPTSGNTGIGLAMVCAAKGYRLIITMSESMSVERQKVLKAYGAELVLTPADDKIKGAIAKAEELAASIDNSFIPQQFVNKSNPGAHRKTTGMEIWNDTNGEVDVFVACSGTGGTITGTAEILKQKNEAIKVVVVEPADSPVLSGGKPGVHKIQGMGPGFIPDVLNVDVFDEVCRVKDEDAFEKMRYAAKTKGIFVGITSGAVFHTALELAKRVESKGKTIVVLFPDGGERYLSLI